MTLRYCLLVGAFLAAFALGQSVAERMFSSSAIVYGVVKQGNDYVPAMRGGGFFVSEAYVVTNLGACCGKTDDGQTAAPVVAAKEASSAEIAGKLDALQVAVLKLQKGIGGAPVTIAPLKMVQKGQPVFTAQAPDPGKEGGFEITEGRLQDVGKLESGTLVIQTTAPMNRANAGGALFDACGNVIGVNAVYKDGVQIAYAIDPLIEGLKQLGVQARLAEQPCGEGASDDLPKGGEKGEPPQPQRRSEWRLPQGSEWVPVVLILGVIALAFRPAARQSVVRAITKRRSVPNPAPYPMPAPRPGPQAVPQRPVLRGITGQYAGSAIAMESANTLGRDPRAANLVFGAEADSVSKRHCTIRWDAGRGLFVIEDHGSTNGTYLASGERLAPNTPRELRPGERFYIGDLRNQFEVRVE